MNPSIKEKSVTARQIFGYYTRRAWRYKWFVIGLFIAVPGAELTLQYLPPLIVANILDRISHGNFIRGDVWASFGSSLVWYGVLSVLGGVVLWRLSIFLIWRLEMLVLRDIARETFDHLLRLSANFHANNFGGSIVSQASKFTSSYVRFADTVIFEILLLFLSFSFAFVILLPRVPVIAVFLLCFSILYMLLATQLTKIVRKSLAAEAKAENKQTGVLADAITNILAVKSFASGKQEKQLFTRATDSTVDATHMVMKRSITRDFVFSLQTVSLGIIALTLAVASAVRYNADVGTTFLVVTYTFMIARVLWEFGEHVLRDINRAVGDAQGMMAILGTEPEIKDPAHPEHPRIKRGEISLERVDFTHPDSRKNEVLFNDLNLHIPAGKKIGLVGHSGSGKTTLTKLLLRFNDIDSGKITIDGQDITAVTQDDLRAHIAYVPQEPLLFHRTIAENIAYGKPNATEAEILAAAKKAYADEFIGSLPKGYQTTVGERGVKLSGGQRQRIAIARALLKDAPILVLDEATSALDSESEKVIQAALWELMKGRTTIVIAHRLSTIQRMDNIVVLDHGRIIEQGSHQQLLKKDGTYAKLWAHQSGGFISDEVQ
ncbi:MAG TPA: ABC transporter ATP-binding protein [Bacillota bacterium]|nr:ABC transporter ATP-binding protein [Bacillota bacterium]